MWSDLGALSSQLRFAWGEENGKATIGLEVGRSVEEGVVEEADKAPAQRCFKLNPVNGEVLCETCFCDLGVYEEDVFFVICVVSR